MASMERALLPLLLLSLLPLTQELSMGGSPLYSPDDKIVILNSTNFQANICGSDRAWMVEFYSSWCGHCIHFAPTYKELAADVYGWREVMSVGAIDCAQEENMPTCREYEVMGYPSLKFFSPATPKGEMGEERQSRDKSIQAIKRDMVTYLREVEGRKERAGRAWPPLLPAQVSGESLVGAWEGGAVLGVLMVEEVNSTMGSEVMLDIWSTVSKLQVPLTIQRVEVGKETEALLARYHVAQPPSLVAMRKDGSLVDSFPGLTHTREGWYAAIKNFIWSKSSELALTQQKILSLGKEGGGGPVVAAPVPARPGRTPTRKELIARRFKVYTSDLEKAVFYSISHEVAQHGSIAGAALQALQAYVLVLEQYFPGRLEMGLFLRGVREWVGRHQDTVRGEDLSTWIQEYQAQHGLRVAQDWIGCKGSEARFGGYPCGLWSLWHALTVAQARAGTGDPRQVLEAMQGYIHQFFGCRECARHFQQAIQDGQAIKEEVESHNDAVLLLWKVHNKANLRLQGDISEDPVFPKIVFPPKEFCSDCYSLVTGTNLWDEYNRPRVLTFLTDLYSMDRLNSQGLAGEATGLSHALVPVGEQGEGLDTGNFRKEANTSAFVFFNGADISICFLLWAASAVLLIGIYLRFVSGKRSSWHLMALLRAARCWCRAGLSSPLLPK